MTIKKATISAFIIRAAKNFKDFFSFLPLIIWIRPINPKMHATKIGSPTNSPELAYSVPLVKKITTKQIKIKQLTIKLFLNDLLV